MAGLEAGKPVAAQVGAEPDVDLERRAFDGQGESGPGPDPDCPAGGASLIAHERAEGEPGRDRLGVAL
eukprot:9216480-Alexandrium_andersonii.AAC.1